MQRWNGQVMAGQNEITGETPPLVENYHRLASAIFSQAMSDLQVGHSKAIRIHRMLDAAKWVFVVPPAYYAFSFVSICQHFGIRPVDAAKRIFDQLTVERQHLIRMELKNYQHTLLPPAQDCMVAGSMRMIDGYSHWNKGTWISKSVQ